MKETVKKVTGVSVDEGKMLARKGGEVVVSALSFAIGVTSLGVKTGVGVSKGLTQTVVKKYKERKEELIVETEESLLAVMKEINDELKATADEARKEELYMEIEIIQDSLDKLVAKNAMKKARKNVLKRLKK